MKEPIVLEKFPKGNYTLVIENDLKKATYQIVITDTNASISSKEIALIYKKMPTNKENLASN
ncbi:MAG: hypothetical protein HC854_08405 [Flavobacterium sp.]|nr:hypothetical protein [Flavobacterium sp.]